MGKFYLKNRLTPPGLAARPARLRAGLRAGLLAALLASLLAGLCLTAVFFPARSPEAPLFPAADFSLTLLHTNDTHSNFGGSNDRGFNCYAASCPGGRGGYVRLDQAVRAIRAHNPEALLLDAGDIFQGTLFWVRHKEDMPLALLDRLGYQAIVPGNHEFDAGWQSWARLVNGLKTPVLAANISFDPGPENPAVDKLRPYIVLERSGRKIGIVGLITENTPNISSPGPGISFNNAREALEKAVAELEASGVKIIIALSHLGLENERRIARSVNGVDVIVGGHSHSFLSNYHDQADGPYPVLEKSPGGQPVLVVSASTACAWLGRLELGFDKNGVVRQWAGEPLLLDENSLAALGAPKPDPELARLINDFAQPVTQLLETAIGSIETPGKDGLPLESPNVKICRWQECLSGNLVADALRLSAFGDAQIAIINSGALRAALPGGPVTPGNILDTLPFQNTAVIASLPGSHILQALEHGVSAYGQGEGGFLQVSGLRYAFNPSGKVGKRLGRVEVMDENGQWQPLDPRKSYRVASLDFIARGGDGFAMLSTLNWEESGKLTSNVLRTYLKEHSPVKIELQGRIVVQK